MIYFTSDTHFGHKNIIEYCNRPFEDVHAMNTVLTENWNSIIKPEDTIYHLGDFAFKSKNGCKEILKHLNGNIVLIKGNHDNSDTLKAFRSFNFPIYDYLELDVSDEEIGNQTICLFHYPILFWRGKAMGTWHLFGHMHGSYHDSRLHIAQIDVGVDAWDFKPVSFDQIKTIITKRYLGTD
jgi:calcineurin-like phosphoesterase family protein